MNPSQHNPFRFYGFEKTLVFLLTMFIPAFLSAQPSVNISGTNPSCNGWTNGSVTANVSGGTAPYTYLWSNGFTSSSIPSGLGAGTYGVTVTDAASLTGSASFTLTQPATLVVTASLSAPCTANGNASANVSGGTAPYTITWDNGSTGANVSGLSAGFHCVNVTDANGCLATGCVNVPGVMSLNLVVQGLACFNFCDASIEAVVSGGTPPYSYSWSNGFVGEVNGNLGPGTYSVVVTDANGCNVSGSATVGNPLAINVSISVTNPPCSIGSAGSATASASGGTAPYSFLWNFGATTATVTGLLPGTYSVTVMDAVGCNGSASTVVVPTSDVNVSINVSPSTGCNVANGSASAVVSGGTAPFSFVWSNGATGQTLNGLAPGNYSVVVTDANGCGDFAAVTISGSTSPDVNITGVSGGCAANGSANAMITPGTGTAPYSILWSNGATTNIINNLTPGTYSVTVTDANGCTDTDSETVTGGATINVSTSASGTSCFGGSNGSVVAAGSGGSGNYTYSWSNGASSATVNNLIVGTYFVTVTDQANGCTAQGSAFVSQPTEMVATANGVNGSCSTLGSASASASGGTAPYTFAWSTGASGSGISNLANGTYTVTATDSHGCTDVATATVSGSSSALSVTISVTAISATGADNGAMTANVSSGGSGTLTYAWSNGASTQTISNLAPGSYTVTVTNSSGCTGTATANLTEPACIGDRVWNDTDRDGCQDGGEFGFADVVVTLTGTTNSGQPVNMTTETDIVGQYKFDNLQPGTYQIHIAAPTNYTYSPSNACTNDFTDSDVNASGNTGNITLTSGQCNITVDGGLHDVCLNINNPGTICCDQVLCGPGVDPAPITSTSPASGGVGAIQYMWMYSYEDAPFGPSWSPITDVNWVPIALGPSYDPGPLSVTTYFIRCAKAANCTDWLETNVVTITVDDVAEAEITGPDVPCVGDVATYHASSNPSGATYSWNFGPWASPSTSSQQNPVVTWNQAGVVYVTLSVTYGGCTSTDVLGVSISDSPIICGNALVVNVNNMDEAVMVDFDVEHIAGNFEFVVQRSKNGTIWEDVSVVPQSAGAGMHHYAIPDNAPKKGNSFYRVQVRANGAHHSFSNTEMVARFSYAQLFIAYPNPASNVVMVEPNEEAASMTKIEIFNMQGKTVFSQKLTGSAMSYPVDLSGFAGGTYLLKMTFDNGETDTMKLTKN